MLIALQTGVLGNGSFGVVLRVEDSRCTPPHEVAVKLLPRGATVSAQHPNLTPECSGPVL